MDEQTRQSLDRVLEYVYLDEKRDYESGDPEAAHIYKDIRLLIEWLEETKAKIMPKKLQVKHLEADQEKKTYAFITTKSFRVEVKDTNPYRAYATLKLAEQNRKPEEGEFPTGNVTQSYYEYDMDGLAAVDDVKHL